jgi:hypothetical protein
MGAVEQHRRKVDPEDLSYPRFPGRWYAEHKEGFCAETPRPSFVFLESCVMISFRSPTETLLDFTFL